MGFWIFVAVVVVMVATDEILKSKIEGYTEKKYVFFKTIGVIPEVTK